MKKSTKKEKIKAFWYDFLSLTGEYIGNSDFVLTHSEKLFLIECAYFNYKGGDLNNIKELTDYLLEINYFKRKNDVYLYKQKIGLKKWAVIGRDKFKLEGVMNIREGDEESLNATFTIDFKNY